MTTKEPSWINCNKCERNTRHEVLYQHHVSSDPDEYPEADTWQIVRCLGCFNVSFLHRYDDYADVEETEYGYTHSVTVSVYPKSIKNHKRLDYTYYIPDTIRNVYLQTLSAYREDAFILASVGLRATIEATCNHLKVSGSSLERRIDQLYKAGYVSNGDKRRLHAIRFLGNDAAHEILVPQESELRVALEIIEHLLNSVFILEKKAKSLETVIETYDEFLETLQKSVKSHKPGDLIGLAGILGKKRRLVSQNLSSFETKILEDISTGKIDYLSIASVEKIDGREIQIYKIESKAEFLPEVEVDIPF